ncbi:hypothetical protein [Streptomyces sp. CBMA156]|uniref:hypothetical protein n=1 Tax=Streptomyces sp. CBMA156 TaxID=1930280 RepID=UPI001661F2A7|nr:hypothetical protein [Streptomyces sp. CBMA156]MBD0676990.1 hypothetical protein [Streptomyces sp. CBMA156]
MVLMGWDSSLVRVVSQVAVEVGDRPGARVVGQGSGSVSPTPCGTETLALVAMRLTNKQIARVPGILTHGAKRPVGSVLLKPGSPDRTAAVITALREGPA